MSDLNNDREAFLEKVGVRHRGVDPCFMTGQGCVYAEVIKRTLDDRKDYRAGFTLMPFRQNLKVFFKNCLYPFFESNYGCPEHKGKILQLGDQVRRPGVIVCEGICKRIQESDFIVADISVPNANVFYELGLAYGIGQKILLIHHTLDADEKKDKDTESEFGKTIAAQIEDGNVSPYLYQGLKPIVLKASDRLFSHRPGPTVHHDSGLAIWLYDMDHDTGQSTDPKRENQVADVSSVQPQLVKALVSGLQTLVPEANLAGLLDRAHLASAEFGSQEDIPIDFRSHVKSAVGLAISKILSDLRANRSAFGIIESYLDLVEEMKTVKVFQQGNSFDTIRDTIEQSYCLIVRSGGEKCHPMAYFWLGYAHARGKNVIPITIVTNPKDPVDDLAFDIRAQRHTTFILREPELLEREVEGTLRHMIVSDFSEWSRKRFWDQMLGRPGGVSVFTGALTNDVYGREMVGDWDLRAASELVSYFGQRQYRPTIESPVYGLERATGWVPDLEIRKQYIEQVIKRMKGRNCILIASPDVNALTEIVLGRIYGVPNELLFTGRDIQADFPQAVVAIKQRAAGDTETTDKSEKVAHRAFYREIPVTGKETSRGFASQQFSGNGILSTFRDQTDEAKPFDVYAHLVIVPNPFDSGSIEQRYVIVLNGVSGPATFALTHVLTGGVTQEFVNYGEGFQAGEEAETILEQILKKLQTVDARTGLQCIIRVRVSAEQGGSAVGTADWRTIESWRPEEHAFGNQTISPIPLPS